MSESKEICRSKCILDFVLVAIVMITAALLNMYGKPYERGFFCNDESLNHPYKSSTITSTVLYSCGSVPHILVMFAGEYHHWKAYGGKSTFLMFGRNIPYYFAMAYNKIGLFVFGMGMNFVTTDLAKYTVGRLRPHFMDLCRPDVDCNLPENQHVYIENFTCTRANVTSHLVKNVRMSFPSGHSSFSAFVMVWIVFYLQLRITWKGSKLLKHFLQLVCIMMAWYTAMSRISDYKHHWSDVLAGLSLGTIVALITVFGVAKLFEESEFSCDADREKRSVGYEMDPCRERRATAMTNGHDVP